MPDALAEALRVHADAAGILSAVQNLLTGEGDTNDRINGWTPQNPGGFFDNQLTWTYAGDAVAAAICTTPGQWLQQAGLSIKAADGLPNGAADLEDIDEDYGLTSALGKVNGWARLFGGAGVLIDVAEDEDWSQPWVPAQGQTVALHVCDGVQLRPDLFFTPAGFWQPDLPPIWQRFANLSQPQTYRLYPTTYTPGHEGAIHWTRVLPILGHELPPGGLGYVFNAFRPWPARSIIEVVWPQLRASRALDSSTERIASVMAIWVMIASNLPALEAGQPNDGSGNTTATAILQAIALRLRSAGVFWSPPGYEVQPASLNLSGLDSLDERNRSSLSSATRIPRFVLYGDTPSGLSGGSMVQVLQAWTTTLRGWWDDQWAANVRRFLMGASVVRYGVAPTKLRVTVGTFVPTTDAERAALLKMRAEELKILRDAGILSVEEGHAVYERDADPMAPLHVEPMAAAPTEGGEPVAAKRDVQGEALNGIQIQAIVESVLPSYRAGQMNRAAILATLAIAFPAAAPGSLAAMVDGQIIGTPPPPLAAPPVEGAAPGAVADDTVDSPDDIPDDTSAADFAAQMTEHAFPACEHGKKNKCTICGIERDRSVSMDAAGAPSFAVKWKAIGSTPAKLPQPGVGDPQPPGLAVVEQPQDA